jgi:hypothetical protein
MFKRPASLPPQGFAFAMWVLCRGSRPSWCSLLQRRRARDRKQGLDVSARHLLERVKGESTTAEVVGIDNVVEVLADPTLFWSG